MADTGKAAAEQTPATREALLELHAAARAPAERIRARQPRVGAGLRRRRPDRDRDRPPRAGDGPAQGLRGDRRQHPRRDPVRDPQLARIRRPRPCCYRSADGRGRARAEPELRAPERLQHPAGVPAGVRLQGGGHRVRPRRDPHGPDGLPRPLRDPAPAPDPSPAAAREADPARDLQPRQAHLPVLRPPGERPHPRPRRPPPPRRWPHVGEPRRRVQAVQPPEGWADARRGACAPGAGAVRAAQRHLFAVHAVPPGRAERDLAGPTSSSAGTEAGRGRAGPARGGGAPGSGDPRHRSSASSIGCATAGTRPTWCGGSLRDALLRREPADWDLATDARPPRGPRACSPAPCTRTGSAPSPCGGTARYSRSRPSGSSTTTRTTGGPTGSSSETTSRRTSRAATSPSTRWPGAARPSATAEVATRSWSTRSVACATSEAGTLRAVGDPLARAARGRAADGPGRPPGRHARPRDRGRRRSRRSRPTPGWSPTCPASASAPSCRAPGGATPVDRAARRGRHGPAGRDRPGARGTARRPAEQGAGRGPVGPHAPLRRRRAAPSDGSSASPRCSTTSASPRRSPTAGSTTMTSSAPSRPRRSSAGFASRRPRSRTSPTSSATTCSRSRQTRPGRPSAGSSGGSVATHVDALFELRRADDIGSGLPPDDPVDGRVPRPDRRRARGATTRSTGARWPSTAAT